MADTNLKIEERVATLEIDRPQARNAIGPDTISELSLALDEVERSDAAALILRGAGDRAFVSGGDLKQLALVRKYEDITAIALQMRRLLDRIAAFRIPVIASLNGHALGGGAEVAVAADIRVASEHIEIGFTQVKLGIMPAWGGAERLAEIVGRSRAMFLIASAQRLSAAEAEKLGLIDVVAAASDLQQVTHEVASVFAGLVPGASESIKAVISAAKPHRHPELEAAAVDRFARLWVDDAHWAAAEQMRTAAAR